MNRAVVAVILVAVAHSAASAGTYLGLGIGTSADVGVSNATGTPFEQGGGRSERFIIGQRFGRLSIEGAGTRYGLLHQLAPYDGTSLAVAAKLSLPLGNNFDVFGRGGLQRTWLSDSQNTPNTMSYSGNGYLLGAGFEYRFDAAVLGGGSIFVDYERNQSSFSASNGRPFDGIASMWTLGLTLAI
jgi:hypothetical protein